MSKKASDKQPKNPLLYIYLQLAYDYVCNLPGEPVHGDRFKVLSRLYRQRMRAILDDPDMAVEPREASFEQLRTWFDEVRSAREATILTARISDLRVGNGTSGQFERRSAQYSDNYRRDVESGRLPELGVESYATYLPIHFFFGGSLFDTDWGIYISEQGVLRLAASLRAECWQRYGPPEPDQENLFLEAAYQILLRHELQHFKIEAFALNAEMFSHRPLYAGYLSDVYARTYYSDDCLEEALANNTVLNSRAIEALFKKLYPPPEHGPWTVNWCRVIADTFFSCQPPGYSNYYLHNGLHQERKLKGFGDRQLAMNFLCNQIVTGEIFPPSDAPFFAFPPDNYFLRAENLVPRHIAEALDEEDSFIHIATPNRKDWERFLKAVGYYYARPGKGDHQIWDNRRPGLGPLTLNYHGKQLDFNSFKSALKTLGITMAEFYRYRSSGQLPAALAIGL